MEHRKRSFFERLTGSVPADEDTDEPKKGKTDKKQTWVEEESEEAELAVDVYQTPSDIVIQTMVAGVKPEEVEATERHGLLTIKIQKVDRDKKNTIKIRSI